MVGLMMFRQAVSAGFTMYSLLILVRVFGSWFPKAQGHPLMQLVARVTDPYLNVFKRFVPRLGMMDLSPMVAMFSLYGIEFLVFKFIL
jgi:YggT family protein